MHPANRGKLLRRHVGTRFARFSGNCLADSVSGNAELLFRKGGRPMRRFTFAITLSVVGGMLAIPLPVQAQRVRSMGMMSQAAVSQAVVRQMTAAQMASPHIMSGGSGPIRWPRPGRPPFGFAVPYAAKTSSATQSASSFIMSGGSGPIRWPRPGRPPFGFAVPYNSTASGSGMGSLYSTNLAQLSPTFSPYASFNVGASASSSQK